MTPALLPEMGAHPTLKAWLDAQLAPASINDEAADALEGWWPRLAWGRADDVGARAGDDR